MILIIQLNCNAPRCLKCNSIFYYGLHQWINPMTVILGYECGKTTKLTKFVYLTSIKLFFSNFLNFYGGVIQRSNFYLLHWNHENGGVCHRMLLCRYVSKIQDTKRIWNLFIFVLGYEYGKICAMLVTLLVKPIKLAKFILWV